MKKRMIGFLGIFLVLVFSGCQNEAMIPDTNNNTGTTVTTIAKSEMVSITGGTFTQTNGTASFSHTISDFSIGKYEVTYELWYSVYQWAVDNGYTFANKGREGHNGIDGVAPSSGKQKPVTVINWHDAIVWCNAYSEKSGLNPCYTYSSAVIKDARDSNATACDGAVCDWSANGYRLPTEGEWQYMASNKGATPYNYASGATASFTNDTETQKVSWCFSNSGSSIKKVGITPQASALTLWDVSGNASEWCWDWFGNYPATAQSDYRGTASGVGRVMRGGDWYNTKDYLPVGQRNYSDVTYEYYYAGLRVAKSE